VLTAVHFTTIRSTNNFVIHTAHSSVIYFMRSKAHRVNPLF